jgi:osmoprotectant transport system permease protein
VNAAVAEALLELPALIRAHLLLSGTALALGVVIGVPLALTIAGIPRLRAPLLGLVNIVQTVPAIALLALFYPLLLLLGQSTGAPIPALGFLPALLALALYALLPIVRNTVAAQLGVPRDVIEAADGVGMTRGQRLRLVELPIGAPVILAGIRTAAVWTIGTATLATTVGQPSLGNLIFSGLQTENWARVLIGCAASAVLALVIDALLGLVEVGVARRSRRRILTGLGALALGVLTALVPSGPVRSDAPLVVIGAKNFSEQYILASLIETRLKAAGYRTERRDDLGSAVAYRALAAGDIQVYVDYTGTLWGSVLERSDVIPAPEMRSTLTRELATRDGVRLMGGLGFENAYVLAMRRARARQRGIQSIEDLARRAGSLSLASDIEFVSRPEWRAVSSAYRLNFDSTRSFSPTFMYRAIMDGSADVLSAFSSDGRIAALDLVILEDPKRAFPNYDAVLLLSRRASLDPKLVSALKPLIGTIPLAKMQQANLLVDRDTDKKTPDEAARWLERAIVDGAPPPAQPPVLAPLPAATPGSPTAATVVPPPAVIRRAERTRPQSLTPAPDRPTGTESPAEATPTVPAESPAAPPAPAPESQAGPPQNIAETPVNTPN